MIIGGKLQSQLNLMFATQSDPYISSAKQPRVEVRSIQVGQNDQVVRTKRPISWCYEAPPPDLEGLAAGEVPLACSFNFVLSLDWIL